MHPNEQLNHFGARAFLGAVVDYQHRFAMFAGEYFLAERNHHSHQI